MATIISMRAKENVDTMGSKRTTRTFAWLVDRDHVRIIKYVDSAKISDETKKIVLK